MPLHSVGRRLQTAGGGALQVGGAPVLDERALFNFVPPFSQWALLNGATVDAEGVLTLPSIGARAQSPRMRIDGPDMIGLSAEAYSDEASPQAAYNGDAGLLYSTSYFAADGVTTAYTIPGNYGSNGRAQRFPKGEWSARTPTIGGGGWGLSIGPDIAYVVWILNADATYSSPNIKFRRPMGLRLAQYEPYAHYYRKGL